MMLIELTAFNSRVEDLQPNVVKALEKMISEYVIPIQISALWCNTIVIRSQTMIPAIATDLLAKLMNYLTNDFYGKHYFVNEVVINKKLE